MGFMSCFDWLAVGAISRGDEAADRMHCLVRQVSLLKRMTVGEERGEEPRE